jgi:DNA-binding winged helix-turn-helix (wHTH) protein
MVRKDDLMRKVWPDSYADAANLTVYIAELNRTLGRTSDATGVHRDRSAQLD